MGIYILNFLLNFYCVIIHQNIDIGIEYFLEKVLNFDIFCQDNKLWASFEYNPRVRHIYWYCNKFMRHVQ